MIVERIKEMNRKDIFLKIVLPAIVIALLIFYFKAFFTEGAYFNNTFLVKSVVGNERRYIGKSKQGDIYITVKGLEDTHENMEVIYRLPGNINRQYTVMLDHENKWYASIEKIVDKDGNIIFEGEYKKGQQYLVDKNGKPLFSFDTIVLADEYPVYDENYEVPLKNIAEFALSEKDTIRGEFRYLIYAIIFFVLTWIDYEYPLFFFKLRYWLEVEDPKPSEFYLMMQRISYVVVPIIGIICMIIAIY